MQILLSEVFKAVVLVDHTDYSRVGGPDIGRHGAEVPGGYLPIRGW